MSKRFTTPEGLRASFRVISGGQSRSHEAQTAVTPATPSVTRGQNEIGPGVAEEDRLRVAVLQLMLPALGISVSDCLDEMCARLDSELEGDIARFLVLKDAISVIGLRFLVARPEFELVRPGFLVLSWPERLLKRHPELAVFRPEAHPAMAIG